MASDTGKSLFLYQRAGERVRTVDNDVGNVVLYQLSYARIGVFVKEFTERVDRTFLRKPRKYGMSNDIMAL